MLRRKAQRFEALTFLSIRILWFGFCVLDAWQDRSKIQPCYHVIRESIHSIAPMFAATKDFIYHAWRQPEICRNVGMTKSILAAWPLNHFVWPLKCGNRGWYCVWTGLGLATLLVPTCALDKELSEWPGCTHQAPTEVVSKAAKAARAMLGFTNDH